jgi:hypothetical protein
MITIFNSTTSTINQATHTFDITYIKSHNTTLSPFYLLNNYKNNDRFNFENFKTYISNKSNIKWTIGY